MTILVTGVAGFIGSHVARALLDRGETVVGVDSLSAYYDVSLKQARLATLEGRPGFRFVRASVSDRDAMADLFAGLPGLAGIVHLAAQAGVRYSLEDPYSYVDANLMGQVVLLEQARRAQGLRHFVYASSSSVYGANSSLPFSIRDRVDRPVSLYAASKRSGELMARTYSHLYGLPATGLRFFTVYGPWGRPDMAPWLFADAILRGRPITVYNQGRMARDFTFVDDIVAGVLAALDRPAQCDQDSVPHRVFNLGNSRAEPLMDFIAAFEQAIGRKAEIQFQPMQPGDVAATWADLAESRDVLGYQPTTAIGEGVPRFVAWFRGYHGL